VKAPKLSLSAKVQRARLLIDETFRDLQESVEGIEASLRAFLGEAAVGDDPSGLADVVPHRRGRPRRLPPPSKSKRAGRKGSPGKRTPEQRERIAQAIRDSWARRRGSKGKAQVAAVGAPAPAARKFEPRRAADPRKAPWRPPNADRSLDSIPLKQTAAEARAEENEKLRAAERKNRVRVNADDVL